VQDGGRDGTWWLDGRAEWTAGRLEASDSEPREGRKGGHGTARAWTGGQGMGKGMGKGMGQGCGGGL